MHPPGPSPAELRPGSAGLAFKRIGARQVYARLGDPQEWAFLDVREQGVHDQGHPFWATCAPLSHFDITVPQGMPRTAAPAVLVGDHEDGGGLAERAGALLWRWGYQDVQTLDYGLQGWQDAGLAVHGGIHVRSKAFGEFLEHAGRAPPMVMAQLKAWIAQGQDFLLIDCRPFVEYCVSSLPGSIN